MNRVVLLTACVWLPAVTNACAPAEPRVDAKAALPRAASRHPEHVDPITLRFVNATPRDLWLDTTHGVHFRIEGPAGSVSLPHTCVSECNGACECMQCGEPEPRTRRIPAGEAFDVEWSGEGFELQRCGECACDVRRPAAEGTYAITLVGYATSGPARGARLIGPDDPDLFRGAVPAGGAPCEATANVTLGAMASTFEIPFTCESTPR